MNQPMLDAIEFLLDTATDKNLDAEVLAFKRSSTAISFQQRKLDQFSLSDTQQIGVRVLDGKHEGVAFSESLDSSSLEDMLTAAHENARAIEKEWVSELRGEQKLPAMDSLFNPALLDVTTEQKITAAEKLESSALDFSPEIQSVAYSRYADATATAWIANTKGLRGTYKNNYCMAYASCLAKDGAGAVMDGEVEMGRDFGKLNTAAIAKMAAEKTLKRRGATRPKTGTYTIVFENRAAESLLGLITGYFSAKAVDENRSPLKGKLNTPLFAKALTLTDDPFLTDAGGSRPFDEEGYASQKTTLVENGLIKNFLTNSVLARKMKLPHTANASRAPSTDLDVSATNIVVAPGKQAFVDLVNADAKVIVISNMLGFAGFRGASGDFSIPMEGSLYENGRWSVPLKDFLISGNILQLLGNVEAVGNDVRKPIGGVISPSLLVRGLNVAGQS